MTNKTLVSTLLMLDWAAIGGGMFYPPENIGPNRVEHVITIIGDNQFLVGGQETSFTADTLLAYVLSHTKDK